MTQTLGYNGLTFPFLNTGTTVIQRYHAFQIGDGDSATYPTLLHGVKVIPCAKITDASYASSGNAGRYAQPPIAVAVTPILPGRIGIGMVKGVAVCQLGSSETVTQGDDIILDQSEDDGKFENGALTIGSAVSGILGYAIADSTTLPIQGVQGAKQDFADNATPVATVTVCFALVDFSKSLGLTDHYHA